MGHKTNPIGLRIGINEYWRSRWFPSSSNLKFNLFVDFVIRNLINEKFKRAGIEKIEIERPSNEKLNVIIKTARPGLIIGSEGKKLKELKESILEKLNEIYKEKQMPMLGIEVVEVKKPYASAAILAELAAIEIEKRMPVRKVMKRLIQRALQHKEILGVKVKISGRLNGAEIARSEWLTDPKGKVPLSTFRSIIDYAENRAYCTYGVVGIKVWLYKGEKI
jgi:small subunit ribosomal protein S3